VAAELGRISANVPVVHDVPEPGVARRRHVRAFPYLRLSWPARQGRAKARPLREITCYLKLRVAPSSWHSETVAAREAAAVVGSALSGPKRVRARVQRAPVRSARAGPRIAARPVASASPFSRAGNPFIRCAQIVVPGRAQFADNVSVVHDVPEPGAARRRHVRAFHCQTCHGTTCAARPRERAAEA
jgi:hypothetical protein